MITINQGTDIVDRLQPRYNLGCKWAKKLSWNWDCNLNPLDCERLQSYNLRLQSYNLKKKYFFIFFYYFWNILAIFYRFPTRDKNLFM